MKTRIVKTIKAASFLAHESLIAGFNMLSTPESAIDTARQHLASLSPCPQEFPGIGCDASQHTFIFTISTLASLIDLTPIVTGLHLLLRFYFTKTQEDL